MNFRERQKGKGTEGVSGTRQAGREDDDTLWLPKFIPFWIFPSTFFYLLISCYPHLVISVSPFLFFYFFIFIYLFIHFHSPLYLFIFYFYFYFWFGCTIHSLCKNLRAYLITIFKNNF